MKQIGIEASARTLRAKVTAYLQKYAERFQPWWDGCRPTAAEEACACFEAYTGELAKEGARGGFLEVAAAAASAAAEVVVFTDDGPP